MRPRGKQLIQYHTVKTPDSKSRPFPITLCPQYPLSLFPSLSLQSLVFIYSGTYPPDLSQLSQSSPCPQFKQLEQRQLGQGAQRSQDESEVYSESESINPGDWIHALCLVTPFLLGSWETWRVLRGSWRHPGAPGHFIRSRGRSHDQALHSAGIYPLLLC